MEWQKILTDSQLPILAVIAYFGKRYFDFKTKKTEVNYTLFQQYRMNAVNNFLTSYNNVNALWNHMPIWRILNKEYTTKDIDDMIKLPMNDLKKSIVDLNIYFTEHDLTSFKSVFDNFKEVDKTLQDAYCDNSAKNTLLIKTNAYVASLSKAQSENEKVLGEVYKTVRDSFKQR